jgi:hypothetical protein
LIFMRERAIERTVMRGPTARQHDNWQILATHLLNRRPTTNAAVLLSDFSPGIPDHMLDPLQLDTRAIGPLPDRPEVPSELHGPIIAEASGGSGRRPDQMPATRGGLPPAAAVLHNVYWIR